jgi:hypothetical protein
MEHLVLTTATVTVTREVFRLDLKIVSPPGNGSGSAAMGEETVKPRIEEYPDRWLWHNASASVVGARIDSVSGARIATGTLPTTGRREPTLCGSHRVRYRWS